MRMSLRMLAVSMMVGLALVGFGASEAKAACIDFTNFCDCLTVDGGPDTVDGQTVIRLFGNWENQDCAGTRSPVQGYFRAGALSVAGELNSSLGLDGVNWNFTVTTPPGNRVFDLDYWDGTVGFKQQNESPYTLVAGACAPGCPALKAGLPASSSR
jgi:hypothetical protein